MEEFLTREQLVDLLNQNDTNAVDLVMLTDLLNFIKEISVEGGYGSICLPMNGFIGNPAWVNLIQSSPSYITNDRVLDVVKLLNTLGYSYSFKKDPRCPSRDGIGLLQISWRKSLPNLALHQVSENSNM